MWQWESGWFNEYKAATLRHPNKPPIVIVNSLKKNHSLCEENAWAIVNYFDKKTQNFNFTEYQIIYDDKVVGFSASNEENNNQTIEVIHKLAELFGVEKDKYSIFKKI